MSLNRPHPDRDQPPSGNWVGFFLESYRPERGWMRMHLQSVSGVIQGEGVDYVGPWSSQGTFDVETGTCRWTKQYVGQHQVSYRGKFGPQGIRGTWDIQSQLTGDFHIWPEGWSEQSQRYLSEPLPESLAAPEWTPLGTVPVGPRDDLA